MHWTQYNPVTIHCGEGSLSKLSSCTASKKILLVTTEGMVRRGTADQIIQKGSPSCAETFTVRPNPDLDELDAAADTLRSEAFDCVVALGGGSAMDSAKALSLLLAASTPGALSRWLRDGQKVDVPKALPLVCLPTTSGTGAEVTPFATIWDTAQNKKRSLAHPLAYPQTAILEPSLCLSLPWQETLFGALDAISHSLETLWNTHATPLSLTLARQALHTALPSLPLVEANPQSVTGREHLQTAALFAGLAISQSKTAIAHSISYPLTLRYGMPHGLACAFTIPAITSLLSTTGSWRCAEDSALAQKSVELMHRHSVATLAGKYCSAQDALALTSQMFTPERAGNFLIPSQTIPINRILEESFL